MNSRQRLARIFLTTVIKPADEVIRRLVATHGPVHTAEQIAGMGAVRRDWELEAVRHLDSARRRGLWFLAPEAREWPTALRRCPTDDQPLGFWIRGTADLGVLLQQAVVVLGATTATPYGTEAAFGMGAELAAAGWTVISTGEFGVPGAAHRGALSINRPTIALPAGGLTRLGPLGHARLFDRITHTGLLLRESLRTVDRTLERHRRARLLASTGPAVVLIEPQPGGLTGATIRLARQRGYPLLVLPGPVTSDRAAYAHQLLRDGTARLIRGAQDVLTDLNAATGDPR